MLKIFLISLITVAFLSFATASQAFDITAPSSVPQPVSNTTEADESLQNVFNSVVTLFFIVGMIGALIYALWGAVDWIISAGDKDKIGNARKKISTALIGLVVLASAFFVVYMVGKIIGIDFGQLPPLNPLGNIR